MQISRASGGWGGGSGSEDDNYTNLYEQLLDYNSIMKA